MKNKPIRNDEKLVDQALQEAMAADAEDKWNVEVDMEIAIKNRDQLKNDFGR